MKKRVILINAHLNIVQKAESLNLEVIHLFTKDNSYQLDNRINNIFVDYDAKEELSKLVKGLNKEKRVNFILSFSEKGLIIMAYLNELLGLNFINVNTVETLNNKTRLRELLNNNNISPLNYTHGNNIDDVLNFSKSFEPPFIVKPIMGYASKSIILIKNKIEIHNEKFTNVFPAIIEDYIEGEEYSVESFTVKGKHFIIGITSKKIDSNFVEKSHTLPAILSDKDKNTIELMINKMLDLVHLENGCAHTEIKIHNGIPKIIESHARPGGDGIPELVLQVYGLDLFLETMKLALDEIKDINFKEMGAASVYFLSSDKEVVVKNIQSGILNHKNIIKHRIKNINVGDRIFPVTESSDRLGYIMVKESTSTKANNLSCKLANMYLELV